MVRGLITSLRTLILIMVLCAVCYPSLVYMIAQVSFGHNANGGMVLKNGEVVGAELIGQYNNQNEYFWPRPSASSPPYSTTSATASNLPYTSEKYREAIRSRYAQIRAAHPTFSGEVPVDMITSSASGLDPHISPHAAYMQAPRVAAARNLNEDNVYALIDSIVEGKQWGIFGAKRVNVLRLNLALDEANHDEK